MQSKVIDIIICDQSVILTAGLGEVISKGLSRDYTIKSCNDKVYLSKLICNNNLQVLISKPEILDEFPKIYFPLLKRISFIYAYYDKDILQSYDGIIQINDTQFEISTLINDLREESEVSKEVLSNNEILTNREVEVLKLMVSGMSTKELSDHLFISVHTVNNHRKNIIKKLGISTISGLTIYAVINDLIDPIKVMKSMKL